MAASAGWDHIPPDLLTAISKSVHSNSFSILLLVCKSWNASMKQHLQFLQPAFLGTAWGLPFSAITDLSAPLVRSKFEGGLLTYVALGADLRVPHAWFPKLQTLVLSAQDLPDRLLSCIGQSSTLQSLDISSCKLSPLQVVHMLSELHNLQHLSLAGVQLTEPSSHSSNLSRFSSSTSLVSLFAALSKLPQLNSLDLDLDRWPELHPDAIRIHGHAPPLLSCLGGGSLATLSLHGQQLSPWDVAAVGSLTRLASLCIDWWYASVEKVPSTFKPPGPGSPWLHLHRLTSLTSLRVAMFGEPQTRGGSVPPLSVAPLTRLRRLGLPGCCEPGLVLSAMRLGASLEELDLSYAWHAVTPGAVLQVCSQLPRLTALDVSHASWSGGGFIHFRLPGDELLVGLQAVRPQLLTLRMQGVRMHGTGLCPGPDAAHPGLPLLRELALHGGLLLRSRVRELGLLHHLRRLTLTDVSHQEFLSASRVGAYLPLRALTALTELRILSTPSRRAGATAPGPLMPGLIADGALNEADAAELGEPVDDGWLPVEHPAGGAPQLLPLQGAAGGQQQQQQHGLLGTSRARRNAQPAPPEPHLQFVSLLPQLQVLVLGCVSSSGECLCHLTGLRSLRVLHISGDLSFTNAGLAAVRAMSMPSLQSLQLMTCTFVDILFLTPVFEWPPRKQAGRASGAAPLSSGQKPRPNLQKTPGWPGQAPGRELGWGAPPGISQLLSALSVAVPSVEHLELGDCGPDMSEAALTEAIAGLPALRYLVLHGQVTLREATCRTALGRPDAGLHHLRYFASWPSSAAVQMAAGTVTVPGGGGPSGGGTGSSPGLHPWPRGERVSRDNMHQAAGGGALEAGMPGETFFATCPPAVLDPAGPRLRGGFILTRVGDNMESWDQEMGTCSGAGV